MLKFFYTNEDDNEIVLKNEHKSISKKDYQRGKISSRLS